MEAVDMAEDVLPSGIEEPAVGCDEMRHLDNQTRTRQQLARRSFLQGAGALTAGTAAGWALPAAPAQAAPAPQAGAVPAMRTPDSATGSLRTGAKPATPPLAVLTLNRMGFGPRPEDIAAFDTLGTDADARLQTYVDQQLSPESIDDSACDAIIAGYAFETLDKSLEQQWQDHLTQQDVEWWYRRLPVWETERVAFLRALHSKRQLMEVLADFWHNHFSIYAWDGWQQSTWVHYDRDVIRGHMLGNFRQMVGAVAKSPAMLYYLDNRLNEGGNPNENWARELFELHTLGAENYLGVRSLNDPAIVDGDGNRLGYIDADVYGATTCFTGWRVDEKTGQFKFDAAKHFPYSKIVLGEIIPDFMGEQDGEIVLDMLANQPGTATFVVRKLCRRLISDTPPESIVQSAAQVFYQNRDAADQLKQVVRTILLSQEFRTTWGEKMKRPFELACSLLRATGCNFDARSDRFFWSYNPMGQPLFGWHPPDGYPDVAHAWSSTMPILQRWRFVNAMVEWNIGGEGDDKDVKRIQVDGLMPDSIATPEAITDWWSQRLLGYMLPAEERQQVVEFIAYGRATDAALPAEQIAERLRYMVALILMAPSFQWR